ncbi:hypothetical protein [Mesorhizobium sp. BR1-1-4]|uniref:hypothetical protein n=1 Tax=Mesorhizobium sp. BR1-1-4 TaxID=2876650 RepID=UPI001CCA5B86|nr:hypothetical protein [Mesorhizobium sp. BR1-1-4]MBZ9926783.1 hypothetical protein [Mesorhizobium sp. BR1-1-4]
MAEDTMEIETDPAILPDPMKAEPGAPMTLNPVLTDADGFRRFRKLWNGGEHRAAAELAASGQFTDVEYGALLGEFPGLIELINS